MFALVFMRLVANKANINTQRRAYTHLYTIYLYVKRNNNITFSGFYIIWILYFPGNEFIEVITIKQGLLSVYRFMTDARCYPLPRVNTT